MSQPSPLAVGVDFGATSIKIGVCQGNQVLKKATPLPTQQFDSPASIIDAMCETIEQLRVEYPAIAGVGLGMPGWVDFHRGVLYQLTNVPVWNMEVAVKQIMEAKLGLPVALDNDANCMAYAEWKLGAGRGLTSLVSLTLGTGVGGGIVVCDQMLRGARVSAAELGMTSIDYQGKVGPFGNRGGVEEYIGNNEMTADAMARYAAAGTPKTIEECSPYALELAAHAGDPIAKQCYIDFAQKLATLMMNLMYTIVPQAFILGGGVAKAGPLLLEPLDAFLKEQLFPVHYENLKVLRAEFGNDAGMIGAAMMSLE
ncbi:MAG: ROK family protein [Akkermansia sp.]